MTNNKGPSFPQYLGVISTFGLTLGINVYILAGLCGRWVDGKLGTSPIFVLVGLFVALVISFLFLVKELNRIDSLNKDDKEGK